MSEETKPESEEVVQQIRTEEPRAPFGEDEPDPDVISDQTADEKGPGERTKPGIGGYAGRDPKTQGPAIPSVEQTQDDPMEHDAKPSTPGEKDPTT